MAEHENVARLLLKPFAAIEKASASFYDVDSVRRGVCTDLQDLGYDFAAIQLVRHAENIIETVEATGIADNWVGRARHQLEEKPELRDIQADIVLARPLKVEVTIGYDPRFDQWLYENYQHADLVRLFVPLVLMRHRDGSIAENWFQAAHCCEARLIGEGRDEQPVVIPIRLPDVDGAGNSLEPEVIGTIEAGFVTRKKQVTAQLAIRTIDLAMRRAVDIHRTRLEWMLDTIVGLAKQTTGADCAKLHVEYGDMERRYRFERHSGCAEGDLPERTSAMVHDLGQCAIDTGQPQFIPKRFEGYGPEHPRDHDRIAWDAGIRALAAIPLMIGRTSITPSGDDNRKCRKEGVLYVRYDREHWFTDDDAGALRFFATWAADAIRHALTFTEMREKVRQLQNLHSVAESLVTRPQDGDLLRRIAWNALNVLAADVVTIYEYLAPRLEFLPLQDWAGRLVDPKAMISLVHANDVPAMLIRNDLDVYASDVREHPLLDSGIRRASGERPSFIERECIESAAALQLRVGAEVVGVIFVNYRRPHAFPEEERRMIQMLASSAAIGIKNRRIFTLSAADPSLGELRDLDVTLREILKRAVEITDAEAGEIRLLDISTQRMIRRASYPEALPALPPPPSAPRGIMVCLESGTRRLGELWVDRRTPFTKPERSRLSSLTTQAVIAILFSEKQEQLIASEAFATLGALKVGLYHNQWNAATFIEAQAALIRDRTDGEIKEYAAEIKRRAGDLLADAKKLEMWRTERLEPVNVWDAIGEAVGDSIPAKVRVERPAAPDALLIKAGRLQLVDVFRNLIQNALDAMHDQGEITLGAFPTMIGGNPWVSAFVRDTGCGVAESLMSTIFQPGITSGKNGHLGFGLWLTQMHVKRFGGSITVTTNGDHPGSTFTVILPGIPTGGEPDGLAVPERG